MGGTRLADGGSSAVSDGRRLPRSSAGALT